MEDLLFTIIVPVDNVEKYLSECLESILKQTYNGKFEIIIVNDGSTDSCPQIINDYKNKFKNLSVISRENKGLLYSRVEAVKKSKGKYIVFVDSDDYLPPNALDIYCKCINEFEYDIIRGNYCSFDDNNNIKKVNDFVIDDVLEKHDIVDKIYNELLKSIKFNSVWRQAVKKEIISVDEIDTSISMGEDIEFNQACYKNIKKMKIINDYLYFYRINNQSMTHDISVKRLQKNITDLDKVYTCVINNVKKMNNTELLKLAYCSYLKTMNAYYFFLIKHSKDNELINKYIDLTILGDKNSEALKLVKYRDINFKYKNIFIFLLLKKNKKVYINLVKFITKFMNI